MKPLRETHEETGEKSLKNDAQKYEWIWTNSFKIFFDEILLMKISNLFFQPRPICFRGISKKILYVANNNNN